MPSEAYSPISDAEIAVDKPLTASLVARMRDNPLAILKGSPSARAAGLGVFVQKDIGSGNQNGIQTDNLDTSAVLRPDGLGGVIWSSDTELKFLSRITIAGFTNVTEKNITRQARVDSPGFSYCCGEVLRLGVSCQSVQLLIGDGSGPLLEPVLRLKRNTVFSSTTVFVPGGVGLVNFSDFLFSGVGGPCLPGDLLYISSYDEFPATAAFCFASFP